MNLYQFRWNTRLEEAYDVVKLGDNYSIPSQDKLFIDTNGIYLDELNIINMDFEFSKSKVLLDNVYPYKKSILKYLRNEIIDDILI